MLALQGMQNSASSFPDLLRDAEALCVLLRSSYKTPTDSPCRVDQAVSHLKQAHFKDVYKALTSTDNGTAIVDKAGVFMARSAQDQMADGRLQEGMGFLGDDRLPCLQFVGTGGYVVITNTELIQDMSVIDILTESLDSINEAYTMWSTIRAEESCGTLSGWAESFKEILATIDVYSSWKFLCSLIEAGLSPPMDDAAGVATPTCLRNKLMAGEDIASRVVPSLLDEEDVKSLCEAVLVFVQSVPLAKEAMAVLVDAVGSAVLNINLRQAMTNFLKAVGVAGKGFLPNTVQEALDEVKLIQG